MGLSINPFLDKFSSDRHLSIPLPFMWEVHIDGSVQNEIKRVLGEYNLKEWPVDDITRWGEGGRLVAQEITIPSESFETISLGQDNRGGWMPGYGVVQRTDFLSRSVSINFLETEKDIETRFFRPWVIAVGSAGLIDTKLHSTIDAYEYTRDNILRKHYKFERAFPTNVEGYTLQYGDGEFVIKTVTFSFHKYVTIPVP